VALLKAPAQRKPTHEPIGRCTFCRVPFMALQSAREHLMRFHKFRPEGLSDRVVAAHLVAKPKSSTDSPARPSVAAVATKGEGRNFDSSGLADLLSLSRRARVA